MSDDRTYIIKTLQSFPRVELEDIRHYFGARVPSRVKKTELVDRLGSYLIEEPVRWLGMMLERDLRLLERLVDAGPEVPVGLGYPDFPSVLETIHLLGSDTSDSECRLVWIPRSLYDVVAPHLHGVIHRCEEDGTFDMERAALGYLQLYGVMSMDEFYDRMLDFWEFSGRVDLQSFVNTLYDSPVLKLCRCNIDGIPSISAPNIFDPDSIARGRKAYPEITSLKQYKPKDALIAGSGSPYFVYGLDSKEGKSLVEMLINLGYSGEDLVREEHEIWVNSQMVNADDTTEAIFSCVTRKQDDISSFDDYDACMEIVAAYANSLPKWQLRGYSSNEKNCLKVILQSEEEDPIEAIVRKNPLMGLFVPPAAPDAPCPCGSGFSYRFCHGRFRN